MHLPMRAQPDSRLIAQRLHGSEVLEQAFAPEHQSRRHGWFQLEEELNEVARRRIGGKDLLQ